VDNHEYNQKFIGIRPGLGPRRFLQGCIATVGTVATSLGVSISELLSIQGIPKSTIKQGHLTFEGIVMVPNEEAMLVEVIGVGKCAVDRVGHVLGDNGVAGEIPRHDGTAFDSGVGESSDEGGTGEGGAGADDDGKPEPAAGTGLTLDPEIGVGGKDLLEDLGIVAPLADDHGEFAELFATDSASEFEGAEVVAGEDEAEGLGETVPGLGAGDMIVVREVASPAVGTEGEQDVVEFIIIGDDEATFHGGDMMREEARKTPGQPEGAGLPATEGGTEGLAVVLDEEDVVAVEDGLDGGKVIGIAKQIDGKEQTGAVGDRVFEGSDIDIQCVGIDIDKPQGQAILGKRCVGC